MLSTSRTEIKIEALVCGSDLGQAMGNPKYRHPLPQAHPTPPTGPPAQSMWSPRPVRSPPPLVWPPHHVHGVARATSDTHVRGPPSALCRKAKADIPRPLRLDTGEGPPARADLLLEGRLFQCSSSFHASSRVPCLHRFRPRHALQHDDVATQVSQCRVASRGEGSRLRQGLHTVALMFLDQPSASISESKAENMLTNKDRSQESRQTVRPRPANKRSTTATKAGVGNVNTTGPGP